MATAAVNKSPGNAGTKRRFKLLDDVHRAIYGLGGVYDLWPNAAEECDRR